LVLLDGVVVVVAVAGEVANIGVLPISIIDLRALGAGVEAAGTGVDCPNGVFAFRRPLGRFEAFGSSLEASNAESEDIGGLRTRFVNSIAGGDLPFARREERTGGIAPKIYM
jgi:hypothetical protein